MAAATHLCFCPPISVNSVPSRKANFLTTPNIRTSQSRIRCSTDLLGDFGARDPFPAEIESQFGEKVLGYCNTEHKILIPTASALSLAQQECTPISPDQTPLSEFEAKELLVKEEVNPPVWRCERLAMDGFRRGSFGNSLSTCFSGSGMDCVHFTLPRPHHVEIYWVVGWRLAHENGVLKLQCTWKLRDFECGVELINRIRRVVEGTGHLPTLHQLEQSNQVHAELWTASIGGLSMNDFIVAAKIDQVKTSDLVPRKRVWA